MSYVVDFHEFPLDWRSPPTGVVSSVIDADRGYVQRGLLLRAPQFVSREPSPSAEPGRILTPEAHMYIGRGIKHLFPPYTALW